MNKHFYNKQQKGFALFVSIVVTATLLLVSFGIAAVAVKEAFLTSASRESKYAFYAADTGVECALYWDVKNPAGYSAFSTTTGTTVFCNKSSANNGNQWSVGGSATSTFLMYFLPEPYCARVTVSKLTNNTTKIESLGYNDCDPSNKRRAERAIRVTY